MLRAKQRELFDFLYALYGDPAAWVERTRSILRRHGISQAELSRRAGLDPSHVSKWIGTRTTTPGIENMALMDEGLFQLVELLSGPEALEAELESLLSGAPE